MRVPTAAEIAGPLEAALNRVRDTRRTEIVGATRSPPATVNSRVAGVGSRFPAASIA
jgi:hypothetical protein